MRILSTLLITSLFALPLTVAACGGDDGGTVDADPYDTYFDCFDDHHNAESLPVEQAIVVCCIDHPIGTPTGVANVVCGDTQAACETYVGAQLDTSEATNAEVTAACADYITKH